MQAGRIAGAVGVTIVAGDLFWILGRASFERPPPGFDPTQAIAAAIGQAIVDTPAFILAGASAVIDGAGQVADEVLRNPEVARFVGQIPPIPVLLIPPVLVVLTQLFVSIWVLTTRTKDKRGWRGVASLNIAEPRAIFVYGAVMWIAVLVTTLAAARSGAFSGVLAFVLGYAVKQNRWISGYPLMLLETVAGVDFAARWRSLANLPGRLGASFTSQAEAVARHLRQEDAVPDLNKTSRAVGEVLAGLSTSRGGEPGLDGSAASAQSISYPSALAILGLAEGCSKDEARNTYSSLCLAVRNGTAPVKKAALNAAWSTIKKERGWR